MPRLGTHIPLIVNQRDWISRTRTARDLLISMKAGIHVVDFIEVDDELRTGGISMGWCPAYPSSWCETYGPWLRDDIFPDGLVLHWPSGTDYCGEGYDATDPILYLADLQFWSSMTADEFRALCEEV